MLIDSPLVRKNLQSAFKEEDHPRSDDGKFGSGHDSAKKPAAKPSPIAGEKPKRAAPGSQLPEPKKSKLRELGMTGTFPPADVSLDAIKFADLSKDAADLKFVPLMSWNQNTGSGRVSRQYRYTQAFHDRNAAEKFDRVMEVEPTLPEAKKKLAETMRSGDKRAKEGAAIASIIMETGLRPTDSDESVKHGHYGVGSILAKHVTFDGDMARLDFIGKEGVRNRAIISDPNSVKYLKVAIAENGPDDPVFGAATSQDALDQLKEATGLKSAKLKDLRTIRATQEARKVVGEFKGPPPPLGDDPKKNGKAIAKAILEMSGKVAVVLNNTATMARDNYIHPEVFKQWQENLTRTTPTTKTMSRITPSPAATTSKTASCANPGKRLSGFSTAKALASSPLYRRKAGFTGTDAHGHNWVNGEQVAIGRDVGPAKAPASQDAAPSAPAAPQIPDAKTKGYADQLRAKFGDQAGTKVQAMAEHLRGTPGSEAKVAALEKVGAMLTPTQAKKSVVVAQANVDTAKMQLDAHNAATDKASAGIEDWAKKQSDGIIARRDAKIAAIKKESEDRLAAIKAKHEAKKNPGTTGIPTTLAKPATDIAPHVATLKAALTNNYADQGWTRAKTDEVMGKLHLLPKKQLLDIAQQAGMLDEKAVARWKGKSEAAVRQMMTDNLNAGIRAYERVQSSLGAGVRKTLQASPLYRASS